MEQTRLSQVVDHFAGALLSFRVFGLKKVILFQADLDGIEELDVVERFGDIIIGAHFHSFPKVSPFGAGGQEDKGNVLRGFVLSHQVQYPIPVELRHHDIADDEIGPVFERGFHALFAVGGRRRRIAGEGKDLGNILPDIVMVVDNQQFAHGVEFLVLHK